MRTRALRPPRSLAAASVALVALAIALVGVAPGAALAAPAGCRTLPVDADAPLRSDLAREEFGVDGTGVRVGIISNTFEQSTTPNSTSLENIADGLLPGPGNPCGYTTPVTVHDLPAAKTDDEGRAMAQLVHGVAPGAQLFFASAGATPDTMIAALDVLAGYDVDIIVDDMSFYDEPWFQASLVSQRIDQLVDAGVTYFSAAANETVLAQQPREGQESTPVNGWRTSAYRPTPCLDSMKTYLDTVFPTSTFDCMDFDPGAAADTTANFEVDVSALPALGPGSTLTTLAAFMQWGEPYGGAEHDFEMVITLRSESAAADANFVLAPLVVDGDYDTAAPVREIELELDPATLAGDTSLDVSLVRLRSTTPAEDIAPPIGFLFPENGPQWIQSAEYWQSTDTDTVGRTIVGHNGAESVITVAATGVGQEDRIDFYSSLGPVSYYLTPQSADGSGSRLAEPHTFAKPSILSVDAIRNTVLSTPVAGEPGVFLFRGTSAASPNAAAVAALGLELDPSLSPAELRALLERSAAPVAAPYATVSAADSIGSGLVDAQALLTLIAADLPVPPAPAPPPPARLAESGTVDQTGVALLAASLLGLGIAVVARRRRSVRG